MDFFELTLTAFLQVDLYFNEASEVIGQLINKSMLLDSELTEKHKKYGYKFYCFDSLYPLESDKTYKQGRAYVFRVRSMEKKFVEKLQKLIPKVDSEIFRILSIQKKKIVQKPIKEIFSITPVIVTVENNPWMLNDDLIILQSRLQANLEKKFKEFYNETIRPDQNFIEKIQILNKKPVALKYKGIELLGNKYKIWINDDNDSQRLAFVALGSGIGEKNSSLGAGFCGWR